MRVAPVIAASLTLAFAPAAGAQAPVARDLDVAFVLDTTGSMAEEIREVKERVQQLAEALRAARPGAVVRFGIVAYRDRGDAYVTKSLPFGPDDRASLAFLSGLRAEGGGDGPEDVLGGLAAALDRLDWNASDHADRQVILIGDAPPHLDYADGPTPEDLVRRATEARIVINGIGCRSLPAEGIEFFRRMAYATEGSYQHIGRVELERGAASRGAPPSGLAGAVLAALDTQKAPEPEAESLELTLVEEAQGGGRDLRIEHLPAPGAAGNTSCGLLVRVPTGLRLEAAPRLRRRAGGLEVGLRLVPGQGQELRLRLSSCVPLATPIHALFQEER